MATDTDSKHQRRNDLLEEIRQRELEPDEPSSTAGAARQGGVTSEESAGAIPPLTAPAPLTDEHAERALYEEYAEISAKGRAGSQHDVIGWYYFDDEQQAGWAAWQARAKLAQAAPAPQQSDLTCPKCKGTGMADSGGVHTWGEPALIPCDCEDGPLSGARPVDPKALAASIAELDAWLNTDGSEPLTTSQGESVGLVISELKYLRAKAAPAAPVQTAETGMSEILRKAAGAPGRSASDFDLLHRAASECDRFYNGMMSWKANAQAKDRTIIDTRAALKMANDRLAALAAPVQAEQAQADISDKQIRDTLGDYGALPLKDGAPERIIEGREQVLILAIRAILSKIYAANRLRDVRGLALDALGKIDAAPALPAQAEQVEAVRAALKPFADLAELFDDGKRASNMPNTGTICAWARRDQEYELTVEHLRAARDALATKEAAAQVPSQWIALGDEWPKNHQDVWVTHKTEYTNAPTSYSVMEAVYVNGMWSDARSDNRINTPTHWMPRNRPLPAAPSTTPSNDTSALGDTGGEDA
jgi:hypothetical protein